MTEIVWKYIQGFFLEGLEILVAVADRICRHFDLSNQKKQHG